MPAAAIYATKLEALASVASLSSWSIIQCRRDFIVYHSAADLDADAAKFRGLVHCREIIARERLRRPFVDIDRHDIDIDALMADFAELTGAEQVDRYRTHKGYHIIAQAPLISFAAHVSLLTTFAERWPDSGVDAKCHDSLRLAGTCKPGQVLPKEFPPGKRNMRLSDTLVQPFDAPANTDAEPVKTRLAACECDPIPDEFVTAFSIAVCGEPDGVFEIRDGNAPNSAVIFDRKAPSSCFVCGDDAVHERDGAFAYGTGGGNFIARCFRAGASKSVSFQFGDGEDIYAPKGPGSFEAVTADDYVSMPAHAGGDGCIAPSGDYLDASPCGLGKSNAAWASIGEGQSVLCLSYRRAFTAKTQSDYGLDALPKTGKLTFRVGDGKRAVVQVDSLARIELEEPGALDVLLIDELRGIRRQLLLNRGSARANSAIEAFEQLTKLASRVIVLDADVCDTDREMFEKLTGRKFEFVRNTWPADLGKTVHVHKTGHAGVLAELRRWINTRQTGQKCAIFAHAKVGSEKTPGVEWLAKFLLGHGLRVKYYHGTTGQDERAADFADVERAFADVDCVVHNATIEAGVSIVDPAFDQLFVFSARMGCVDVLKQASHRFRCVTRIDYGSVGGFSSIGPNMPQTDAGICEAIRRSARGGFKLPPEVVDRNPAYFIGASDSFIARNYRACLLEEFRSARHYDARLIASWLSTGFAIVDESDEQPVPEARAELEQVNDAFLNATEAERIAQAPALAPDEFERLSQDTRPKSAEEMASVEKGHFSHLFEINPDQVTAEIYDAFAGSRTAWIGYRASMCGAEPAGTGSRIRVHATALERCNVIDKLTSAIGFGPVSKLCDAEPSAVRAADIKANSREIETIVKEMRADWGRLFPEARLSRSKNHGSTRDAIAIAKTLLATYYGIEMAADDAKNSNRSTYRLTPTQWPAGVLEGVPPTFEAHRAAFSGRAPAKRAAIAVEDARDAELEMFEAIAA